MNNTFYVPTWLYVNSTTYLNLTKMYIPCHFSTFSVSLSLHVFNHTMVGLVINPVYGLSHSNLGQLKCVRPPGIFGAISAIIIEYIISVYTPLRYHRMRALCSSSGIMYMRSFASILVIFAVSNHPCL